MTEAPDSQFARSGPCVGLRWQRRRPYDLLEKLGEGRHGQVFKGRHRLTDQVVALKVIHGRRLELRRSAPTDKRRPAEAWIRPCDCGSTTTTRVLISSKDTRRASARLPSFPTASSWPAPARIGPSRSGTRPSAGRSCNTKAKSGGWDPSWGALRAVSTIGHLGE